MLLGLSIWCFLLLFLILFVVFTLFVFELWPFNANLLVLLSISVGFTLYVCDAFCLTWNRMNERKRRKNNKTFIHAYTLTRTQARTPNRYTLTYIWLVGSWWSEPIFQNEMWSIYFWTKASGPSSVGLTAFGSLQWECQCILNTRTLKNLPFFMTSFEKGKMDVILSFYFCYFKFKIISCSNLILNKWE